MKQINFRNLGKYGFFLSLIGLICLQIACQGFVEVKKGFENAKSSQAQSNQKAKKVLAEEFNLKSASDVEQKEIYGLFTAKKFDAIEKIANEARLKKERLAGGYWKIDSIYEGLTNIYAEYPGQEVTDDMWKNRLETLNNWKENSPESITARIALAKAYIGYGWFARGNGYISTVSKENYDLLHQRLDMAEQELTEADKLTVKCPRWYREMLYLTMAKSASSDEFNQIFEEAIKFEPSYLQFYLVKSENLTPKWNGKQGDWQKFVDELPSKLATLDTDESDAIYFTVIVNKLKEQSLNINFAMLSKERIKNGFAYIDKKYKVDNFRLNQFAFVSCLTQDFPSARETFERIGDDWNKEVWGEQTFTQMKQFATQSGNIAQNR